MADMKQRSAVLIGSMFLLLYRARTNGDPKVSDGTAKLCYGADTIAP